jgi:hypothetical protein
MELIFGIGLGIFGVIFISRGYAKLKKRLKPTKKIVEIVQAEKLPDGTLREYTKPKSNGRRKRK